VVVEALAETAQTLCAEHDRRIAEFHAAAAAAVAAASVASSSGGAAEREKDASSLRVIGRLASAASLSDCEPVVGRLQSGSDLRNGVGHGHVSSGPSTAVGQLSSMKAEVGGQKSSRKTLSPWLTTPSEQEDAEDEEKQSKDGSLDQIFPKYLTDYATAGLAAVPDPKHSSMQAESGRRTLSPWYRVTDGEDQENEEDEDEEEETIFKDAMENHRSSGMRLARSGGKGKKVSMTMSKALTLQEVLEFGAMGRQVDRQIPWLHRVTRDRSLQNSLVEASVATIVLLNLAVIGISTDIAKEWRGWIFVNTVFALLFSLESVMKVYLVGAQEFGCGPERLWNVFEAALAMLAILEVALAMVSTSTESHLSLLRVVRLARLARVIRICRLEAFSELMMMINGAVGGVKTLLWSIVLISLPLYAVALLMRETLGELQEVQFEEQELAVSTLQNVSDLAAIGATGGLCRDTRSAAEAAAAAFKTLPWSFFSVFRCVVGQDCSSEDGKPIFLLVTKAYGWGYGLVYCVTMLLMTFGLFNVIVAIYVENTVAAAKVQEMTAKQSRLNNYQLVAEKLHELVEITCEIWEQKIAATLGDGPDVPQHLSIPGLRNSTTVHARVAAVKRGESILTLASNLEITPKFLDFLKEDPRVLDILRDLDIADADIRDLFETLDVDGGGTIDTEEMIRGLTQLRGDASRSDIVGVKLVVRNLQEQLSAMQAVCQQLADTQKEQLEEIELLRPAAQRREQLRAAIAHSCRVAVPPVGEQKRSSADSETLRI